LPLLLGGICHAAQVIPPIPTHFSVAWSVCRLSHSCTLLNRSTDLDAIWQLHFWGPMTHRVRWSPWPSIHGNQRFQGRWSLGVKPPAKKCNRFRLTKKDDL